MTDDRVLPYGRHEIDDADIEAVIAVLRGDWLTQGPAVERFESSLRQATGSPNAIAVSSGTAALHVAMHAAGIGPGDLVLVPSITFVASANAALYVGAEVLFVDVEPQTGCIDVRAAEQALEAYRGPARPRAIVAVHFAGLPCDLDALGALCERRNLVLIEDACHALGATWTDRARRVHRVGDGTVATCTVLSFHPVKHITTAEGGAVLCRDTNVATRAREFRTHGITRDAARLERNEGPWWYEQHSLGFNYRLPDVLATLGASQLTKLDAAVARRRAIAGIYRAAFANHPGIGVQAARDGADSSWHLFPILVANRASVFARLTELGIRGQVHYIPVHRQPFYVTRYGSRTLPGAENWYEREISLPMFPALSDADISRTIGAVLSAAT